MKRQLERVGGCVEVFAVSVLPLRLRESPQATIVEGLMLRKSLFSLWSIESKWRILNAIWFGSCYVKIDKKIIKNI